MSVYVYIILSDGQGSALALWIPSYAEKTRRHWRESDFMNCFERPIQHNTKLYKMRHGNHAKQGCLNVRVGFVVWCV